MEAMMKRTPYLVALLLAASLQPARADVLDGLIFGAKCMGAADRKACEEQAKRDADETRARMRQQPNQSAPTLTNLDSPDDTLGKKIYRNWRKNVECHPFSKRSVRDVDSTYAQVMNRYSFVTPNQAKLQSGTGEAGLYIAGYLHESAPGALYRLEQVVYSPDVANGRRQYKLRLDLARDGSGTRVTGQYCVTTDDPTGWRDLPDQVLKSLNNTF
ncbi:MAG: hypothetical protein ROZ37_15790 [Aromatoleum sp.]|jgi:hypothetical protein|uniref:hypothetical protein n=1 Tax=Aromatoleum sp. TaxID=2307007 RepID=UPI002894A03D|nr:hypothetical protein [Aromatoleum sp.]MDT3671778.1 hypothetical protein [Aromatoleum sp.]